MRLLSPLTFSEWTDRRDHCARLRWSYVDAERVLQDMTVDVDPGGLPAEQMPKLLADIRARLAVRAAFHRAISPELRRECQRHAEPAKRWRRLLWWLTPLGPYPADQVRYALEGGAMDLLDLGMDFTQPFPPPRDTP